MLMQEVKPMSFAWTPDYYGHGRIAPSPDPEPAPPEEEVGPMCHVCQENHCDVDAEAEEFSDRGSYTEKLVCDSCKDDLITCTICDRLTDDSCDDCPDDESYCDRCKDNKCFCCDECEKHYNRSDVDSTNTGCGNRVCEACLMDKYSRCDECEKHYSAEGHYWHSTPGGIGVCDSCYENSYGSCEGCGETFHCDDLCDDRCEGCSEDEDSEEDTSSKSPYIFNYSHRISIKPKGDGPLWFGVELEVETKYGNRRDHAQSVRDTTKEFCILKEDGSLTNGFEIVSCPATLKIHQSIWGDFFANVPKGLISYNSSHCGMHVHVSRKPLTQLQIGKILVFINEPMNENLVVGVARRNSKSYAKIITKKHSDARKYAGDIFQAVNLCNDDTIEFRIFKGTLIKESFLRNIEFCAAVVQFCAPSAMSLEEARSAAVFARFVTDNRKTYPHLHAHLEKKGSDES